MPNDPPPLVRVGFTPEFKRNLRQLAKKYRHIKSDLQEILDELADGKKPGDQIPRVRYEVYEVRAKNSDAQRGKRGGYRLIYYVKSASELALVTVYSKTEQSDIAPEDIRRIILDSQSRPASDATSESESEAAN